MKKIFFCLGLILLCGCGSSTDEAAFRNDLTKDVFKLAIVSAGCSMLDNSDACLEAALEETHDIKRKEKTKNQSRYSYVATESKADTCLSDLYCSTGQTCLKKNSLDPKGICVKKVDQYGMVDLTRDSKVPQCNYLTDCPIGFKCDPTYKVCVKD